MKAEQQRIKEEREAEALKDATFAPQINGKSNTFAKKRVSNADIYTRLNAEKPVIPEPVVVEPPKKVLPKEDVEKIFRRLSITNTVSTEVGNTLRATGELPESPEHKQVQRKRSIVLPEKDIDSLFNRLHTTSYDHSEEAEPAVKPVMKQATPRQVHEIVDRLSKSPAEAWLDQQSPRRSSRILGVLGSPSNDSYEVNSLSSSVVGTPKENNRKEFFRDPVATTPSNHSSGAPAAAAPAPHVVHPGDFPPTPPARVPAASKIPNGNSASSSTKPAGIALSPAAAAIPEEPKPPVVAPTTPVVPPTPPAAAVVATAAPAPVASAPVPVAPTYPVKSTTASAPATSSSTTSSTKSNSAAGAGAANPDFFSKLEASLAFLETQLDTKPSAKSPAPKSAPPANEPAPSYASVMKS